MHTGVLVDELDRSQANNHCRLGNDKLAGVFSAERTIASGESTASFDFTVSSTLEVMRAGGEIALAGASDDYVRTRPKTVASSPWRVR
jgi:hypothetical protein